MQIQRRSRKLSMPEDCLLWLAQILAIWVNISSVIFLLCVFKFKLMFPLTFAGWLVDSIWTRYDYFEKQNIIVHTHTVIQSEVVQTKVLTNLSIMWLHNFLIKFSSKSAPIGWIHLDGGFLFCGSRKLTYFHGGKRKYSVISTDFGHKNSDGNGNIIF